MNERMDVSVCIETLIELIDDQPELDDLSALLCAVGAACGNEELAAKLLDAITPIMIGAFIKITAENN